MRGNPLLLLWFASFHSQRREKIISENHFNQRNQWFRQNKCYITVTNLKNFLIKTTITMKKTIFSLFVFAFFLIFGCSNTADGPDFIDGKLLHPIQCVAINPSCEDRLPSGNSIQCRGINVSGNRCGNNTLNACGYCGVHLEQAPLAGRCMNPTKNASGYCDYHKELLEKAE